MTPVELREEPPGGDAGRFLRSVYWSEVCALAGLPAGDGPSDSDLTDLAAPGGAFVVAGAAPGPDLGCVGVRELADGSVEVKRLYVSAGARGQGVGRRLLAWCEDWARARGATRLVLDTHGALTAARALYLAAGLVEVERYNDNPDAQHWYAKSLRPAPT